MDNKGFIKLNKKWLGLTLCSAVLGVMLLNNEVYSEGTEHQNEKYPTENIQMNNKNENQSTIDSSGLLVKYYEDTDFKKLALLGLTTDNSLGINSDSLNDFSAAKKAMVQSISWTGLLKIDSTDDYIFELKQYPDAEIVVNGKDMTKQSVKINKNELVSISIQLHLKKPVNIMDNTLQDIQLMKKNKEGGLEPVTQTELFNPTTNRTKEKQPASLATDPKDYDHDGIPDDLEINGYTVKDRVIVPWDPSYVKYQRYVSDPNKAYTTGDPYSDSDKAFNKIPTANAKETRNPLVAAFPRVTVGLEAVSLTENIDISNAIGVHTTNNWSYTNTEGVSIEAGFTSGSSGGFSLGVSANYEHSETVGTEWGDSKEKIESFNNANAAYFLGNVRYYNISTGAIFNAKPTMSFSLDGLNLATVKAQDNITAQVISPNDVYPAYGQSGVSITASDGLGLSPIMLDKESFNKFTNNVSPILLQTNQTEGNYAYYNETGQVVTDKSWSGIKQDIEKRTASLMIDTGERISEKRIIGKNYDDPEDRIPVISLKEALIIAYPEEITEKDGLLYYEDKPLYESSIMTIVDKNTAKLVDKQLKDTGEDFKDVNSLYDVKLEPGMNFTLKLADLFDSAEDEATSLVYNNMDRITGGKTGNYQHQTTTNASEKSISLTKEQKKLLSLNTKYYLNMHVKASNNTTKKIQILDNKGKIITEQSESFVNDGQYKQITIPFDNLSTKEIDKIVISEDNSTSIQIDDISFVKTNAVEEPVVDTEKLIKESHSYLEEGLEGYDSPSYMSYLTMSRDTEKLSSINFDYTYKVKVNNEVIYTGKMLPENSKEYFNINFSELRYQNPIPSYEDIQVYAVYKDKDILIADYSPYNVKGTISFKNAGEDGQPEILGAIDLNFEGQKSYMIYGNLFYALSGDTTNWVNNYDTTIRTFNPDPSGITIKADITELDYGNGDDILAYPDKPYNSSKFEGTAFFQGDESGSSVTVTYKVSKIS
ncbi:hypothetical protein FZM77_07625 [Enterococcus faecium]|nr:hypothetical protein [Enterococcus faecium]MCZ2036165.1 hypothetical protein [Enterococcus faecium]MCZ2254611.1 hypothetical protein [Enterococcus faecium]MCZ2310470.1 hypothetical protein [Enterococcus faecium]MCZ2363505.1 hypothetical protein [Enterococcus faecium]